MPSLFVAAAGSHWPLGDATAIYSPPLPHPPYLTKQRRHSERFGHVETKWKPEMSSKTNDNPLKAKKMEKKGTMTFRTQVIKTSLKAYSTFLTLSFGQKKKQTKTYSPRQVTNAKKCWNNITSFWHESLLEWHVSHCTPCTFMCYNSCSFVNLCWSHWRQEIDGRMLNTVGWNCMMSSHGSHLVITKVYWKRMESSWSQCLDMLHDPGLDPNIVFVAGGFIFCKSSSDQI